MYLCLEMQGTITQYRKQLALFIFNYNKDINITDLTEIGNGSSEESDGRGNDDGIGLEVNSETGIGSADGDETGSGETETIGSADFTDPKRFRLVDSILTKGPKGKNIAQNRKQVYVDTINLTDDDLLLWINPSQSESPFNLYKRSEPDPDKAIKFMNHIFDNYGNDRYMLYFVICFRQPTVFFLALVSCRISWRLNLFLFPIHSKILLIDGNQGSGDRVSISGKAIKEEFGVASHGGAASLLFFIYCLRSDDIQYRPKSVGYRVIIEPQIAVHLYFI